MAQRYPQTYKFEHLDGTVSEHSTDTNNPKDYFKLVLAHGEELDAHEVGTRKEIVKLSCEFTFYEELTK